MATVFIVIKSAQKPKKDIAPVGQIKSVWSVERDACEALDLYIDQEIINTGQPRNYYSIVEIEVRTGLPRIVW